LFATASHKAIIVIPLIPATLHIAMGLVLTMCTLIKIFVTQGLHKS
jgi:hypothetical protein